ncbi:copper chaperone PCu(A)C [Saccharomonospora sp. CUA-673]|uniref:copper chaperone PCu(A)C n=1 Tax=Saccharomonospora sp. CUA-673 TaxID=1904969 RepID=UPI00111509B0|nr:copper chaperone PCu(A)C [Saccharomonospora sp. CUA-673]
MINTGQNPDELVSVTSPDADDASISGRTTLPADTTVAVGPEAPQEGSHQLHAEITLNGLNREVRPGQDVTATLTFREAGTVEVRMPVKTPDEPRHNEPVPEPEKHLTPH